MIGVREYFLWFPVMTFDGEISGIRAEYLQCIRIVVIIYSADEHEYIFCQKISLFRISLFRHIL